MSTPEGKVKLFIDTRMKEWFPNAVKYSPPGVGRFGKNGFPDRIWWIKGNDTFSISVCIEAKAEGKQATCLQLKTLIDLRNQGCLVAVVAGKDKEKMDNIRQHILERIRLINEVFPEDS